MTRNFVNEKLYILYALLTTFFVQEVATNSSCSSSSSPQSPTTPEAVGRGEEAGGQAMRGVAALEPLGEEAGPEVEYISDSEASVDSLDEGLGDINCENEV